MIEGFDVMVETVTSQATEASGESRTPSPETLDALAREGAHSAVLRAVATADPSPDLDRIASASFLPALAQGLPLDWPEVQRAMLWRRLIRAPAPAPEGGPRPLHFAIASAHSGGDAKALPHAAAALREVLFALWTEAPQDHGVLLMALLLRSQLNGWRENADIRDRHLALLPDLTAEDLTIAWNLIFDPVSFAENRRDIADLLAKIPPEVLILRFRPWQILRFHWITGGESLDPFLPVLLKADAQDDADREALASLALRAAARGGDASRLPTDILRDQARAWAALRPPSAIEAARARSRMSAKPFQAAQALRGLALRRIPSLRRAVRPRIAVCISGQLRGFRAAFPTWQAGLLQGADCSFFVHAWEGVGRSGAEPFRAFLPFEGEAFCAAWRDHAHRAGIEEMRARYPTLFAGLSEGGKVTADALRSFYGTEHVVIEDDRDARFDGWSNSRKMHHKLAAAQAMIGDRLGEFDLVLRIRPDKELGLAAFAWSDLIAAAAEPAIFADIPMGHHYGQVLIGDQVAVGLPKVMAAYAETGALVPKLAGQGLADWPDAHQGHASLARTCWHAGIRVGRLPVKMGRLLEASPMRQPEIATALRKDAEGRMDAMDLALIEAAG